MTSVYLTDVTGDGVSPATAFAPVFPAAALAVLMVDEGKGRALLVSSLDTASGPGIVKLLTATGHDALITAARSAKPTSAQRNGLAGWLATGGYRPLTGAEGTWWDCIQFAARQVNPAADLARTSVSG